MKITFITTVLNEEETINGLLCSLIEQSKKPDEIIITDGGSTDQTVSVVKGFRPQILKVIPKMRILIKKGNRSVGRNYAIRHATGEIIACSDAGCLLDKYWLNKITKPFNDKATNVVAGYYRGQHGTIFQKSLLPYVLVMSDKVDGKKFLPATRSMSFRKSLWEKVGGFKEKFSHNEDYVFAKDLEKIGAKRVFIKDAIVFWMPPKTVGSAFRMFFRFAYGDAEALIFRPKIGLVFIRYFLGLLFIAFYLRSSSPLILMILCFVFFLYLCWAIAKNYHYVNHWQALFFLPLFQLIADIAIISGTLFGLVKRLSR